MAVVCHRTLALCCADQIMGVDVLLMRVISFSTLLEQLMFPFWFGGLTLCNYFGVYKRPYISFQDEEQISLYVLV